MKPTRAIPSCSQRYRQLGLTLLELMISLTIGLFLVAGISTLIARQSSTRAELDKSARQIENGRYAMTLLQDDIQHAGGFITFLFIHTGQLNHDAVILLGEDDRFGDA